MNRELWAAYLAMRTLKWHFVRTLVASLSVAIGVAAFGISGLLGQAEVNRLVEAVERNEGRPATILVDPGNPLSASDASALDSVLRVHIARSKASLTELTLLGPMRFCTDASTTPQFVNLFGVSGDAVAVLGVRFGRIRSLTPVIASRQLENGAVYSVCGAPGRHVRAATVGHPSEIPDFENAGFVSFNFTPADALILPAATETHYWLAVVDPKDDARAETGLRTVTDSWERTRGVSANEVDVRRLDTAWRYAKNVSSMTIVLRLISAILLLTGVLGLANVQLVLLRQRVKNLALLRAFGATGASLAILVVLESTVIALTGGAIGIGFAIMILGVIRASVVEFHQVTISAQPMLIAAAAAVVAGVSSGLLPAVRARKLDVGVALFS